MTDWIITCLLSGTSLLFTAYLAAAALYRKDAPRGDLPRDLPRVSLLKPVGGMDDGLEENLDSFYRTEYPDFEVLFAVREDAASCRDIIERVARRYPAVRTETVTVAPPRDANPKVAALAELEPRCTGSLYWITDANVRVGRKTLGDMVSLYAGGAKLVCSPVRGSGGVTPGSIMENAFHNAFSSMNILLAWRLFRRVIPLGKSLLIEREAFRSAGGFPRLREYLSEDLTLGRVFASLGIPAATSGAWVTNYNRSGSVKRFGRRLERWSKMRYRMQPLGYYLLELAGNPVAVAALAAPLLGTKGLYVLGWTAAAKIAYEYANLFLMNPEDARKGRVLLLYPACILAKDAVMFLLFCAPFFGSTVTWRGIRFSIGKASRIDPVPSPATDRTETRDEYR